MELAGGVDAALQARAIEREVQVIGAELAQHGDDPIAAEVCRVRHWRAPVALGDAAGVLVQQPRVLQHRLVLQLFKIGADGEMTVGHDGPPRGLPGVRWSSGERRFVENRRLDFLKLRWTRSCPRTGGGLHAVFSITR